MPWKKSPRFKILTINLPFEFIDLIQEMKDANIVPSRSEYIRQAVWEKLSRDLEFMKVTLRENYEVAECPTVLETNDCIMIDGKVWNKK